MFVQVRGEVHTVSLCWGTRAVQCSAMVRRASKCPCQLLCVRAQADPGENRMQCVRVVIICLLMSMLLETPSSKDTFQFHIKSCSDSLDNVVVKVSTVHHHALHPVLRLSSESNSNRRPRHSKFFTSCDMLVGILSYILPTR